MADDWQTFQSTAFYRDPMAALRWLEAAFGFETTTLVTDDQGRVGYSEMTFQGATVSVNPEFTDEIIG
ncbi:MAG: VOC family protein, partial [Proteobacteria bacterium]|nr:VOC family protein [Pseudomonadota bacterium]